MEQSVYVIYMTLINNDMTFEPELYTLGKTCRYIILSPNDAGLSQII